MQEIKGHKNTAYVYADNIEQEAVNQIHAFLDSPAAEGGHIAIMPDVHAGAGCVVGFTQMLGCDAKVVPNLVGVDIGCGVSAVALDATKVDFDKFDRYLRANVPSGFNIRNEIIDPINGNALLLGAGIKDVVHRIWPDFSGPEVDVKTNEVMLSIGTLGGGNHFIELDRGEDGRLWLVVHTGSRNFGLQVANHHQRVAEKLRGGKFGGLAWLDGKERDQYLADLQIAQALAGFNRSTILYVLGNGYFGQKGKTESVSSVHNYIGRFEDTSPQYVRKGAISAHTGEKVIIPFNMAEGCVIGTGKSNPAWNFSAPHGAGRTMSRSKAKASIDVDRFTKVMRDAGVWSSCVGKETLDEAPMAYKRSKDILEQLKETVEIEQVMRPIYNFKAGDEGGRKKKERERKKDHRQE